MIAQEYYLAAASILFIVGIYCVLAKRNMVRMIMGIEIMMGAASLNFAVFSAHVRPDFVDPLGHSFAILSIMTGACMVAVALALVVCVYQHYRTRDVRKLNRLKW
ncbi:MAG: NADH-quinone oxidoreductase subunit NuoK [archaeon]